MIEFPLLFLSGLLGSGHCVGMCGAFAMAVGWQCHRPIENMLRQLLFSLGRATTYVFLGATVGFAGQRLAMRFPWLSATQGALSILAGIILVLAGLYSFGWLPVRWSWLAQASSCPAAEQFRSLLKSPHRANVLVAGMLTGFLPCGLVYGVLTLAAATHHALQGALVMAVFALGTMPLMIATGMGASMMSVTARTRLLKLAAVCVMSMGVITAARGVAAFASPTADKSSCPFCER